MEKKKSGRVLNEAQAIALTMQEAKRRGLTWFNETHAAGMVASFMTESNFLRSVIEFKVKGDNGTAHGLMQWRGPRFRNLVRYSKQLNSSAIDVRTQIAFAFEEGSPKSPYRDPGSIKAFKQMAQAQNVAQATTAFVHAERPRGYDGNARNAVDLKVRLNNGRKAMTTYANSGIDYTDEQLSAALGPRGAYTNVKVPDSMPTFTSSGNGRDRLMQSFGGGSGGPGGAGGQPVPGVPQQTADTGGNTLGAPYVNTAPKLKLGDVEVGGQQTTSPIQQPSNQANFGQLGTDGGFNYNAGSYSDTYGVYEDEDYSQFGVKDSYYEDFKNDFSLSQKVCGSNGPI